MSSELSGESRHREPRDAIPPDWTRLEDVVRRLLDDHAEWRNRAERAEHRLAELEATLRENSAEGLDAVRLAERVETLRRENEDLRRRLSGAREAIERIMSRLRFLEEAR